MRAIKRHRNTKRLALLLAAGLAISPLTEAAPFSYMGILKQAESSAGAPAVFAKLDAMNELERKEFLDEQRGGIDMLRNMRSLVGDDAGTAQASAWFDIASDLPAKYASHSGAALKGANAEDALQAIVREASTRQIVFLNEAHHVPLARVFAARLAKELRKIGFTYLACETFDEHIPARPAAITRDMGFYLREPMYGGFLRSALRDGWTFVGYDTAPEAANQAERNRLREVGAARNIMEKVFAKDPKAKIFIYVGYGHAMKQKAANEKGWKSLATLLREGLGKEPLTIDQATMYARGNARVDHPQYRATVQRLAPLQPIVLRAAAGGYAVLAGTTGDYDMQVFHPDETALNEKGRPLWMERQAGLTPRPVPANLLPASGRRLVQAYHAEEGATAVPADQLLVEAGKPAPAFMLPKGQFRFSYEK